MSDTMGRVAANLSFIEPRALTGPGYYAVQVFEELSTMAASGELPFSIRGYVQDGARHHFSQAANTHLSGIGNLKGRARRVAFEHLGLPFRSRRDRVDLLWSPAFVSPLWGTRLRVVTIHDMYYRIIPELVEPRQRKYWELMIPPSARTCGAIIAVSHNTKKDIIAHLPVRADRVFVTPLASRMRESDFKFSSPLIEGDYVLVVANTTPNKNCKRIAEAIAVLRDRGREIRLVHIGNDIDGRLRAAAAEVGIDDLLVSLGKVSDATLANAYQHCRATVVASIYEGFGMPAAEAQAMGAPLICSRSSAVPEAAGGLENGAALFIDPLDVTQIANAIDQFMSDDQLRAELSARGLKQSAAMSWRLTAEQTAAVFTNTLATYRS
jgi:glycosyltransferase involved in cell wall biosynthesis